MTQSIDKKILPPAIGGDTELPHPDLINPRLFDIRDQVRQLQVQRYGRPAGLRAQQLYEELASTIVEGGHGPLDARAYIETVLDDVIHARWPKVLDILDACVAMATASLKCSDAFPYQQALFRIRDALQRIAGPCEGGECGMCQSGESCK